MSTAEVVALQITGATIESLSGNKISLLPNILGIDYFENILEPSVTMEMQLWSTNSLFNLVPIRGGEKVTLEIPKGFIQVIYQALDITTKQVGLNGAEALVVVAKEIAKQTGEEPPKPEEAKEEESE